MTRSGRACDRAQTILRLVGFPQGLILWWAGTHDVDLLSRQVQARQVHELQVHVVGGVAVVGQNMDAHPPATRSHRVSVTSWSATTVLLSLDEDNVSKHQERYYDCVSSIHGK